MLNKLYHNLTPIYNISELPIIIFWYCIKSCFPRQFMTFLYVLRLISSYSYFILKNLIHVLVVIRFERSNSNYSCTQTLTIWKWSFQLTWQFHFRLTQAARMQKKCLINSPHVNDFLYKMKCTKKYLSTNMGNQKYHH